MTATSAVLNVLQGRDASGRPMNDMVCMFTFDTNDPLAIKATFAADKAALYAPEDTGLAVAWTFGRQLLSDALDHGSAGVVGGDVHVAADTEHVYLNISSPFGTANFVLPTDAVSWFLHCTVVQVPIGGEHYDLLDAEISALMAGEGFSDD